MFNRKRRVPGKIIFSKEEGIPSNFYLAEDVMINLKNKKYMDPISLEEIDIKDIDQFACVFIKGIYQIYKKEDLMQHIKTSQSPKTSEAPIDCMFRDINTNVEVRTSLVRIFTPDQLYNYFFLPELATKKRRL